MNNGIRTYSELISFDSFIERFEYLKLNGKVFEATFGFERYLNQIFYESKEWKNTKREVVIRDNGCDLGMDGYEICGMIIVHHINPITPEDIRNRSEFLLDPEYLISTSFMTHKAITLGNSSMLVPRKIIERSPNDTCPWRK